MSLKKMGKYLVVGIVGIFVATTGVNAASMPDAVDGKITLTGNLELTETFTVAEDETITLDLAGYTITGSADIDYYTIENNGNLTIIDSGKTKGKIVCLEDNSSCIINNNELLIDGVFATSPFATIKNEETGNLTVKNATIETTRVGNSQTVGFTGALQNWGTAKVMDSTILAENEYAVFVRSNETNSDITISGSTLNGDYAIYNEKLANSTNRQNVTVSDTDITGKLSKLSGVDYTFSGDITIHTNHNYVNNVVLAFSEKGTKVTIDVDFTSTLVIPDDVTVVIAEGKTLTVGFGGIKVGNGKLELQGEMKNANVYVENTNAYYTTLRYAVNSIPLDSKDITIKLLADTTDTSAILMSRKEITVDLNGYTATVPKYTVANNAELTLVDSSDEGNGTIAGTLTNNGKLTIDGGKFLTLPTTGTGATTTITGGTFSSDVVEDLEIPEDKEVIVNDDGTSSIVYKKADYSKLDAILEEVSKLDKTLYTEESWAALEAVVNSVEEGLPITEQEKVNGYVDAIRKAMDELEEQFTVEDPDDSEGELGDADEPTTPEVPQTFDSLFTYVGVGVVSVVAIAGAVIYIKRKQTN